MWIRLELELLNFRAGLQNYSKPQDAGPSREPKEERSSICLISSGDARTPLIKSIAPKAGPRISKVSLAVACKEIAFEL